MQLALIPMSSYIVIRFFFHHQVLIEWLCGRLQFRHSGSHGQLNVYNLVKGQGTWFFGQFFAGSMCITCKENSTCITLEIHTSLTTQKNQKKEEDHTTAQIELCTLK
jgi:hypothetical protein